MSDALRKARHGIPLRDVSGNLSAGETVLPLRDLDGYRQAVVRIRQEANLVTPDADDEVRFFVETAYGHGEFNDSGNILDADIDNTQTLISLDAVTGIEVGNVIRIGNERMLVTEVDGSGNNLTVQRGFDASQRTAHATNDSVFVQEVDWVSVANVTYDLADNGTAPRAVIVVGGPDVAPAVVDGVQADVADNSVRALPLGDRLRLRTTVAGATAPTYNYSADVSLLSY